MMVLYLSHLVLIVYNWCFLCQFLQVFGLNEAFLGSIVKNAGRVKDFSDLDLSFEHINSKSRGAQFWAPHNLLRYRKWSENISTVMINNRMMKKKSKNKNQKGMNLSPLITDN